MRSLREICFRLRQETGNFRLLACPPATPPAPLVSPPPRAPDLVGTAFGVELQRLAQSVLEHRFPLFGTTLETGPEIAWRRDYVHGVESGAGYCRFVKYLDFARSGDHKIVWELNRHQHLVVLAQAFLLSRRREYLDEIVRQCESWTTANPYLRGMNWASALEVAFRALSWMWVDRLAGGSLPESFRNRFYREIYRHGCYLEQNLSVYFSPNTHLLGEAVALHALGVSYPSWPRARIWKRKGAALAAAEIERQVQSDGSHFEQSSYYHLYALDFFLLHYLVAREVPLWYREKLSCMADYLHALIGCAGKLPFLGDDDGGRVFHPYGPRESFARATLATCASVLEKPEWLRDPADVLPQAAWWTGADAPTPPPGAAPASRWFPASGTAVLARCGAHVLVRAGGMGWGRAGHSHADALSVVVYAGQDEILIDPGTYTYVAEPEWRNWFRGTAAHNTIRIDEQDQARDAGPFAWESKPQVRLLAWRTGPEFDLVDAECRYSGFRHRRRVLLAGAALFFLDEVEGPPGMHLVEQFWHPAQPVEDKGGGIFQIGRRAILALAGREPQPAAGGSHGWRSRVFASKEIAPVVRNAASTPLPVCWGAALDLSGAATGPLIMEPCQDGMRLHLAGGPLVVFAQNGAAVLA